MVQVVTQALEVLTKGQNIRLLKIQTFPMVSTYCVITIFSCKIKNILTSAFKYSGIPESGTCILNSSLSQS